MGVDSLELQALTDRLEKHFDGVQQTILFNYTTIAALAAYLATLPSGEPLPSAVPSKAGSVPADGPRAERVTLPRDEVASFAQSAVEDEPIAIVGMSARFPQAPDIWAFWDNLEKARDCVQKGGAPIWSRALGKRPRSGGNIEDGERPRWGGYIEDVDHFDALLFKVAPKDADLMDPQERLSLHCAWSTLEHAGYGRPERLKGRAVGVFWGTMWSDYSLYAAEQGYLQGEYGGPGAISWAIANRISYFFDFTGPSLVSRQRLLVLFDGAAFGVSGDPGRRLRGGPGRWCQPLAASGEVRLFV